MNNTTRTDKVRLKSRVGPVHLTWRPTTSEKYVFDFDLDNSCTNELPKKYWETIEHEWLDRTANLRYKDALIEL